MLGKRKTLDLLQKEFGVLVDGNVNEMKLASGAGHC